MIFVKRELVLILVPLNSIVCKVALSTRIFVLKIVRLLYNISVDDRRLVLKSINRCGDVLLR